MICLSTKRLEMRILLVAAILIAGGGASLSQQAEMQPYTPVRITITDLGVRDPSFVAFRDRMREIIRARDRAVWRRYISPQLRFARDFGGIYDKRKTAVQNLERALHFDVVDENGKIDRSSGWKTLEELFSKPFGHSEAAQRSLCAPARPRYDEKAFEQLLQATRTDALGDWDAIGPDVNVHVEPRHTSPVIERTGLIFIRTIFREADGRLEHWRRVVTPSGKTGFIRLDSSASIFNAQLCVAKNNRGEWRIVYWVGGGD
jgi:hypothetical protein